MNDDVFRLMYCLELASIAHQDQRRKSSGHAFINHPIKVANLCIHYRLGTVAACAAFLHDVPEDTALTLKDLEEANVGADVLSLVALLTNPWGDHDAPTQETKRKHYDTLARVPLAVAIKLIDRGTNLTDMRTMISGNNPNKSEVKWVGRYLNKTAVDIHPLREHCIHTDVVRMYDREYQTTTDTFNRVRKLFNV